VGFKLRSMAVCLLWWSVGAAAALKKVSLVVMLHVINGFCTYYCGYGLCWLYTRNYKYKK
jgi:hypothetical protein